MSSSITAVLVDAHTGIPVEGHDDIDVALYERCAYGIRSLAVRREYGTWEWVTTHGRTTWKALGYEVREVRVVYHEQIMERFIDALCDMFARIAAVDVERQNANERKYERQMERFYGDIGPQTLDEQLKNIWREGARLAGAR